MPTIGAELAKDPRAPLKTGEALESPSLEVVKRHVGMALRDLAEWWVSIGQLDG